MNDKYQGRMVEFELDGQEGTEPVIELASLPPFLRPDQAAPGQKAPAAPAPRPEPPPPKPVAPQKPTAPGPGGNEGPTALVNGIKVKAGGMLGNILVENEFMTHDQLLTCLEFQSKSKANLPFGKIAQQLGFVTEEIIVRVLEAQKAYVQQIQQAQRVSQPATPAKFAGDESPLAHNETVFSWLASAQRHRASDLYMIAGKPLILRHNQKLLESKQAPLDPSKLQALLLSLLTKKERLILKKEKSLLKCIDLPGGGRARANIFAHHGGFNGIFRLIPSEIPSVVTLNLPRILGKFTTYQQGIVILAGPISSGKTTTLAALVDVINRDRAEHVISIEHPAEFVFKSARSLITQRQVGVHTDSFHAGLKASLREDPDTVIISDLKDVETTRLALSAAETGHLVIALMHSRSARRTLSRLIDFFPPEERASVRSVLAEHLRGIVVQHLVSRADAAGMVPVTEIMVVSATIRHLIRGQKESQLAEAMRMGRESGSITLVDYAEHLVEQGIIDAETINHFVNSQQERR